jgi:hypothetical protein
MLTELVDLPSKGRVYPPDNPLSSGQVEIKYMTAKEEDILTTQTFIESGVVIDKLLESLIVTEDINLNDLTAGDKNKLLLAARILAYGKTYEFEYEGKKQSVDLTTVNDKGQPDLFNNSRYITFTPELFGKELVLKLINSEDLANINEQINAVEKAGLASNRNTTTLINMIHAVDGDESNARIRTFVNEELLARDSMAIKLFIREVEPDIDFKVTLNGQEVEIPIGINFFYPTAEL